MRFKVSRRELVVAAGGALIMPLARASDPPPVAQGVPTDAAKEFLAPVGTIWELDLGDEPPATVFSPSPASPE